MTPAISILVPVYNAASYLDRFFKGLVEQHLADAEYVFIDDGSPDDSWNLLQELSVKHGLSGQAQLVKLAVNGGVSEARQAALDRAHGEYVIFADPDDWVEPGMYAGLLAKARAEGLDLAWEDFYENETRRSQQAACETGEDFVCAMLGGAYHGSTCNKLMRRVFLQQANARFPEGRICLCEDLDFLVQVFLAEPKAAYLPACHYHYVMTGGSATHGLSRRSFESLRWVREHLKNILPTSREQAALNRWSRGANLACFLQPGISDAYFQDYIGEERDLRGLSTNRVLKMLYWLGAHGVMTALMRFVARKGR